jgi:hypothetical protein
MENKINKYFLEKQLYMMFFEKKQSKSCATTERQA